eukprot:Plantae.Rhodophyta-Purpureofilum_apyrenoidigerum.ctg56760.p1 GENE.Plantae.Rhodophyta-Purpureofilum_apyrenoidigerum.ctg56760~~Plantae.Rhodophyta-Purpureofilum_apyrenoidigerum.ctg56760.p1  ORF type:complete len:396 (-),score=74.81 Plantae.Rhodophyta-Purpureofilum_apyrenoidigerum.ctg56760:46-1089(-)
MAAVMPMPRIGHGFDLHRLEPNNELILGGILLEHDRGCVGHSDGDAVYHCVVDAILGALSLPDIGQKFPDNDPKWKGAPSDVFMKEARKLMEERGYEVGNVDVTVILEKPKMSPHKDRMRNNIAELLGCDYDRVNLKAKTHEKVDAVGENRAVACHTVALLLPRAAEAPIETPARNVEQVQDSIVDAATFTAQIFNAAASRVDRVMNADRTTDVGSIDSAAFEDRAALRGDSRTVQDDSSSNAHVLDALYATVMSRKGADAATSWTAKLFSKGREKISQKVGEEAVEAVIAGVKNDREGLIKESADLLYHLNVLWADAGVAPHDVWSELQRREGTSGIAEKQSRPKN